VPRRCTQPYLAARYGACPARSSSSASPLSKSAGTYWRYERTGACMSTP